MARAPRQDANGDTADLKLLREARKRFDIAWTADRENRTQALEDLAFLVGDQWPEDLRLEREGEQRPCPVENRLPQFVDQIMGDIRQQKPAAKVRPVDDVSDPKTADVMTSLLRDIEGQSQNSQPYVRAAESAVQCGIGHFRILTKYSRIGGFDQEIVQEPILNPFAVVWDPLSRSVTRSDARYCFVIEEMDRDEFKIAYPDANVADFETGDASTNHQYLTNWYTADTVKVAEYWFKTPVKRRFARLAAPLDRPVPSPEGSNAPPAVMATKRHPMGAIIELDPGEEPPEGAEVRTVEDFKVSMVKMSGLAVLEGPTDWLTPHIPIVPVLGKEIVVDRKVVRHGAIRFAKDPQWRFNVWLATLTELIGLQPKAPYLATPAQIKGHERRWKEANVKNLPVLLYNPDPKAPGAPQRAQPVQGSEILVRLMMMAEDAMKATTGQYAASLGQPSNETSGRAIDARRSQANTIAYIYTDNLVTSIRYATEITLALIPKIYDSERVVRLLNEDGSEAFEKINVAYQEVNPETGQPEEKRKFDLTVGRYDVLISTGPAYATKRQEAAAMMMEFLRTSPEAAKYVMDLIARNMDWPGAEEFADRFAKMLPPELKPKPAPDEEPDPGRSGQGRCRRAEGQGRRVHGGAADAHCRGAGRRGRGRRREGQVRGLRAAAAVPDRIRRARSHDCASRTGSAGWSTAASD